MSVLRRSSHYSLQKIVCVDLSAEGDQDRYSNSGYSQQIGVSGGVGGMGGMGGGGISGGVGVRNEAPQNSETLLQPACGNRMAFALLLLLEQDTLFTKNAEQQREIEIQNRQNDPFSVLNKNRDLDDVRVSTIRLIVCNIPLPCNLPAQSIFPILRMQQRRTSNGSLGYSAYGFDPQFLRSMGHSVPGSSSGIGGSGYGQPSYGEYRYEEQGMIVIRGLSAGITRAVRAIKSLVATSSISY